MTHGRHLLKTPLFLLISCWEQGFLDRHLLHPFVCLNLDNNIYIIYSFPLSFVISAELTPNSPSSFVNLTGGYQFVSKGLFPYSIVIVLLIKLVSVLPHVHVPLNSLPFVRLTRFTSLIPPSPFIPTFSTTPSITVTYLYWPILV